MIRFFAIALSSAVLFVPPSLAADSKAVDRAGFEATLLYGQRFGGAFESVAPLVTPAPPDSPEREGVKRDLSNDDSLTLILNWSANEGGYYELLYSKQTSELEGVAATTLTTPVNPFDLSVEYLHIGGVVEFGEPTWRAVPYFALTVGGTRFKPERADSDSETEFSLSVGGGVKVPFNKYIGLRFDVRAFATWLDSGSDVFCVSDSGAGSCDVRVHGDSFIQGQVALGVTGGF
jgi:hypothetical protein